MEDNLNNIVGDSFENLFKNSINESKVTDIVSNISPINEFNNSQITIMVGSALNPEDTQGSEADTDTSSSTVATSPVKFPEEIIQSDGMSINLENILPDFNLQNSPFDLFQKIDSFSQNSTISGINSLRDLAGENIQNFFNTNNSLLNLTNDSISPNLFSDIGSPESLNSINELFNNENLNNFLTNQSDMQISEIINSVIPIAQNSLSSILNDSPIKNISESLLTNQSTSLLNSLSEFAFNNSNLSTILNNDEFITSINNDEFITSINNESSGDILSMISQNIPNIGLDSLNLTKDLVTFPSESTPSSIDSPLASNISQQLGFEVSQESLSQPDASSPPSDTLNQSNTETSNFSESSINQTMVDFSSLEERLSRIEFLLSSPLEVKIIE